MFTKLWMVLALTCAVGRAADVPAKPTTPIQAKPELRGILTDDDFAALDALSPKINMAQKISDIATCSKLVESFHDITSKLEADPEGWTDAEYDAKVGSFRRAMSIAKKTVGMGPSVVPGSFLTSTGAFVADSADQQEFAKRWTMQSKLLDIVNLDIIRRKETLDFVNNHPLLFPDIPTRIKFIDWLASVNIKTKVLNEIRADLVGEQPDAAKPNQRKQKP